MSLDNFFYFESTFSKTPVCVSNDELNWDISCKILKGDYLGINFPLVFKQTSGKKWTDFLNPISVSLYIVSQKFVNLLLENDVKGWDSFSVKIFDKKGDEIRGYVGFSITGKCGAIEYSKSKVIEKHFTPNNVKTNFYKGLNIGLDKWDKSDLFIPEGSLIIVATDKVKKIVTNNKITNIVIKNIDDYEISEFAIPKNST